MYKNNNELITRLSELFQTEKNPYDSNHTGYAKELSDIVPAFKNQEWSCTLWQQFSNGSGGEIYSSPPKMHAASSSSAQCVNAFAFPAFRLKGRRDFWVKFLGIKGGSPFDDWSFECKFPILTINRSKMRGTPPNLDFAIWNSHEVVAIESKLTEILKEHKQEIGKKYFSDSILKNYKGLEELAHDVDSGKEQFTYLNAAQLIKHALGLLSRGVPFHLGYIYNEHFSSEKHYKEVSRFTNRISEVIGDRCWFFTTTYQAAFKRIRGCKEEYDVPGYDAYLNWFESHYLKLDGK